MQFFIFFFSCNDLASQFLDLLISATDSIGLALDQTFAPQSVVHGPAASALPESLLNMQNLRPHHALTSRHLYLLFPLPAKLVLVWLILARLIPSLHFGLCSKVTCRERPFLTSLTRVAFLLHSTLSPCFTFFITFITTWHYFRCIHLFTSFHKYLGNTHYMSGTVLRSGDTEENKIKSLCPPH